MTTLRDEAMRSAKEWKSFQDSGLLWWVNRIIHTFGWAIVYVVDDDGTIRDVYPSRVAYRGFNEAAEGEGFVKVSQHIADNADMFREVI